MLSLSYLAGKDVLDGGESVIAVADGLNVTFPENRAYLRLKGERLKDIRGRVEEFVTLDEIDHIDGEIHLYPSFDELKDAMAAIDMKNSQSLVATRLISMDVKTSDDHFVGVIRDILVSEDEWKVFYVIEGELVAKITGKTKAILPFYTIDRITDVAKLDLTKDNLKVKKDEFRHEDGI